MKWFRLRPGLKAGDKAPSFDLPDEEGRRHRLGDYSGRWLVIFFYPKDNSPICVREACAFNDELDRFRELGAEVLGCSGQDAGSHRRMRSACRLRYRLLCDTEGAMREAWQVPRAPLFGAGRTSYIVDPAGVLRFVFNGRLRGEGHVRRSLEWLQAELGRGN